MTLYLLDTNAISDLIAEHINVSRRAADRLQDGDTLGLCRPVYYELWRGFLWRNARGKLRAFIEHVRISMEWVELADEDWEQAARFWAEARRNGKQLGDPDLFLAALAYRENAIIVSSDSDFDALPVRRENWRE